MRKILGVASRLFPRVHFVLLGCGWEADEVEAAEAGWVFWHLMQSTGCAVWTATRVWATESEKGRFKRCMERRRVNLV